LRPGGGLLWTAASSFRYFFYLRGHHLVTDGFILVGGPVGDGQQTLHVVEACDETEVRRRVAEDPWATLGLLEVGAIQPWALWLDFRATMTTG